MLQVGDNVPPTGITGSVPRKI